MARTFGGRPTLGQMTRQPWGGVKPVGGGFDTQAPFSQAPETQAPFFAPPETQGGGWGQPPETQGPFGVRAGDSQGPGWSPAPSFAPPEMQGGGWSPAPSFAMPDSQGPFGMAPETQGAGWGAPPAVDPWAIQQAVNVGPMSFGGNRATLAKLARGGR